MTTTPSPQEPGVLVRESTLLLQLGRGAEALSQVEAAIALGADSPDAWTIRGLAQTSLQRWEDALRSYDRALALHPTYATAHINRGVALRTLGRPAEALREYEAVLVTQPQCLEALVNQAAVLMDLGRFAAAAASFDRALALHPGEADLHFFRGLAAQAMGERLRALASYDRAAALRPGDVRILNARVEMLLALQRYAAALVSCDELILLEPDMAEAHFNRACALRELERLEEALAGFERASTIRPDWAEAHLSYANIAGRLQRRAEALASYDRAIASKPDLALAYSNRAVVLSDLGRLAEALSSCDRALALEPGYADAFSNRGTILEELGRPGEALASYQRAIEIQPENADAHNNRAMMLLLTGDFSRGWPELEWRWKTRQFLKRERLDFRQPLWLGEQSLAGRTILLHAEQGFGDTLQFCRYATLVAEQGAQVILQVPQPLKRLLRSVAGVGQVITAEDELGAFDYHCPLVSLPLAFNTRLTTVPARVPYLHSAPAERLYWQQRLGTSRRPRIGVVWSGGIRPQRPSAHMRRDIALAKLAALGEVDADFFSLQKGEAAEAELSRLSRAGWCGPPFIDYTAELRDFADTAGLVEQLDLVISVDTSTAHLAGAMGKPVWLLNRYDTCWRWLLGRRDSPWYPTMTLYRQRSPGDWDSVVRELHTDLREWARGRSGQQQVEGRG